MNKRSSSSKYLFSSLFVSSCPGENMAYIQNMEAGSEVHDKTHDKQHVKRNGPSEAVKLDFEQKEKLFTKDTATYNGD